MARLALVEELLELVEPRDCAVACLAFLSSWAGLERGLVLVVDRARGVLSGLAGAGGVDVDSCIVALTTAHHPLVRALAAAHPVHLSRKAAQEALPSLPPEALWAVPLRLAAVPAGQGAAHVADIDASVANVVADVAVSVVDVANVVADVAVSDSADGAAVGVLCFAAGDNGSVSATATWVARRLAQRLLQLEHARAAAGHEALVREASSLRSILNTVLDPIVMTDASGRIVIANATAGALLLSSPGLSPELSPERSFAPGTPLRSGPGSPLQVRSGPGSPLQGRSGPGAEGRHRAIALNNMAFTAALLAGGVREAPPGVSSAQSVSPTLARRELPLIDPRDGTDLLFELLSSDVADGQVSMLRNLADLRQATEEIEGNYRRVRIAEVEVRAERDRLDSIIDAVADPIVVADPGGGIILMNPPAERLFSVADDVPSSGADGDAQLRRVRENDAVFSSFVANLYAMQAARWSGELGLVDPVSGAAVPVEAFAGNVVSERGEVTAVVTILHDRGEAVERDRLYEQATRQCAELRRTVQEATGELVNQKETLRRQALALERARNAKSQFLANISHELRTPLNAIIGYTQLMIAGAAGVVPENIGKKLERVDSNSKHLLAIIDDLLDVARIESGNMPLKIEPLDLAAVATAVLAELDPLVEKSGLQVDLVVDPQLSKIDSDQQKVKQILLNLVSNSLKFTKLGTVKIRLFDDRERVSIAVEDTGSGIPVEDQEKIFEDFRQGQNTYSRNGGTGLGLAICLRLAKLLDGGISMQSTVGMGSTFTLHLPRKGPQR